MYCKKCGNEISDGAKFCKFCGAVQETGRWQHSVGFTSVSELDHGCGI